MEAHAFIGNLRSDPAMQPEGNVFAEIWSAYERVIMESLIISFGLDFIVKDQYGGDVDTVHNVRKMKNDSNLTYKNMYNENQYRTHGDYNTVEYHGDQRFRNIKKDAKKEFNEKGTLIEDAYTGRKIAPNKGASLEKQAQLDHVIAAKDIHDDAGRILAGLAGVDLANDPCNLRFTNACLNNNMKDKSIPEYIKWCEENPDKVNWNGKKGEPLPEDVKKKLMNEYNCSKKEYDKKINTTYYTSPRFMKDTAKAAGKRGVEMGVRQALGFVFMEIWFAVKNEIKQTPNGCKLKEMFEAIGAGVQKGFANAKSKYKELIAKVEEGFAAGALSSLTTTICNIFFTTAKNLVKNIRQIYASVVQAGKVLLFNPDNLMLGDRIKTATIILATGASVLVGTAVGELIGITPIGNAPAVGPIIQVFCSSMISGIISCTLLVFLDRSEFMNKIIYALNQIPTESNNFTEIAEYMERLAAKIANLDIEKFKKETRKYKKTAEQISKASTETELNVILRDAYASFRITLPWKGDFNEFMSNKNNHLVFE